MIIPFLFAAIKAVMALSWKDPKSSNVNWLRKIWSPLVTEKISDQFNQMDSQGHHSKYAEIWFPVPDYIAQNHVLFTFNTLI